MKYATILSSLTFATFFLVNHAKAEELAMNMAQMQAMDKITGRVSIIEVPVGGEVKFGSFSVVVRACHTKSEEEIPENTAFVDVADKSFDKEEFNIFKGWMFSSSPAVNAIEHPIYDVWLIKCFNGEVPQEQLLSADELRHRDELPRLADVRQQQKNLIENSFEKVEKNIQFKDSMYKEELPQHQTVTDLSPKEDGEPENLLNIRESYEEPEEETVILPAEELSKAMNEEITNLQKQSAQINREGNIPLPKSENNPPSVSENKIELPEDNPLASSSPIANATKNQAPINPEILEPTDLAPNLDNDLVKAIDAELAKHQD